MKKLKLLTSMLLTLVLIVSLMPAAMAAEQATVNPETDKGTVTITLKRTGGETLVPDVNVTLHQVGVGRTANNNLFFDLVPALAGTQTDGESPAAVTLDGLTAAQNTAYAAALKKAINNLSDEEKATVSSWTVKTGEDGKAVFAGNEGDGGLHVGVYLVQSEKRGGYQPITPFLIYLPITETEDGGSHWDTEVAASPKVEYQTGGGGGGNTKPDPEEPPEIIPDDPPPLGPGEFPDEEPDLEDIFDEEPPLAMLPQTGLLQWPIPVMAMTGLLLVALGLLSEQKRKARN